MENTNAKDFSADFHADGISIKFIAFCDILGFSHAVENNFENTVRLYQEFMPRIKEWPFGDEVKISMYSDSILVTSDKLPPLLNAVQGLCFATLTQDWLIRGGIAQGKYWEDRRDGNLFVVSDALVKAVRLEQTSKMPAVFISPDIEIPIGAWAARFENGPYANPVLHFEERSLVNPFNRYWFESAKTRVTQMRERNPRHSEKYDWFLRLAGHVETDELLVPQAAIDEMIQLGILEAKG